MTSTRHFVHILVGLALLLPLVVALPAGGEPRGTWNGEGPGLSITSDGPLTTITTSPTLNCSVNHIDDEQGQFYRDTACGTFLALDGVLYGPSSIPAGFTLGAYTPYVGPEQTTDGSGTVDDPFRIITTVRAGEAALVTQVDSYVVGHAGFRTEVTVTNLGPDIPISGYLYRAADCHLADSDVGRGLVAEEQNVLGSRVGCINDVRAQEFVPITGGSTFFEGGFADVWHAVRSQDALPNTCRCEETIDNGMALAWRIEDLELDDLLISWSTQFPAASQLPIESSNVPHVVDAIGRNTFMVNGETGEPLTIGIRPVVETGCEILDARITHGGSDFPLTDPEGDGVFVGTIPFGFIYSADVTFTIVDTCGSETGALGRVALWDPSGAVTAGSTGQPVDGAVVTLYNVPGWRPATPGDTGAQTCETVPTRGPDGWTQPAPTDIGVLAAVTSGTFSPDLNPQVTSADGRYGWDVAEGCWYVTVTAEGFDPLISPVVGVPPEVTDLDLVLLGDLVVAEAEVARLSGPERIATAIAISQDSWDAGGADTVLIARHDIYPDSLAGGPLAVAAGGPMLLTPSEDLFSTTAVEVQRVLSPGGTVHLLGGLAALSDEVATDLMQMGYTVRRVSGPSRYDTSVAIAEAINPDPTTILVADGNTFADALIASSAAPARNATVVLTSGVTMPGVVADYLDAHGNASTVTIGSAAAAALPNADQSFSGSDVYDTSQQVATAFWPSATGFAVASGENFPDALAGSAHSGARGYPLLLSPQAGMTASVLGWLNTNGPFTEAVLYGGTAALSPMVESQVLAALATQPE